MRDNHLADARLLERFSHHVGKGITRFSMIRPGDRVLIGVSGGKDSLALSLALVERKKWVPIDYELRAVQVEWREFPLDISEKAGIDAFYETLEIPFNRIVAQIAPPTFKKKFSCYTCSRNRKRLIFEEAARVGASRIALAHHMDDIAQTTLFNIFFHGEFATMMPVQQFFGGAMTVIRPLCEVRESEIARLASRLHLPAVPNRCPNVHSNKRSVMKEILRIAAHVNRHAVSNVYSSPWRINQDYLPSETRETAGEPDSTDGVLPSDWL